MLPVIRDWLVELPMAGFLFPGLSGSEQRIYIVWLYYSKNAEELKDDFVEGMFGCGTPLTAARPEGHLQCHD